MRLFSERLVLVPMDIPLLICLLGGDLRRAEELGGFAIPRGLSLRTDAVARRIRQLEREPDLLPWLLHAIVIRESGTMCGRIGFHSAPGPRELAEIAPGGIELGYEVDPAFRRRGYARESALALMRWAFAAHGQRSFVLSISPENLPSLAMAASMGFGECGSRMDETDGIELYFLRRIEQWPVEWSTFLGGGDPR